MSLKNNKTKNKSKKKKRSLFRLFSRNRRKSNRRKSNSRKSKRRRSNRKRSNRKKSSKYMTSKNNSSKTNLGKNNIIFTISDRKNNSNKNRIIHKQIIPNSPLQHLNSLLSQPRCSGDMKKDVHKKSKPLKEDLPLKNEYPIYLNDLIKYQPEQRRLSTNLMMAPSSQLYYPEEVMPKQEKYKRVETSTYTSQNIDGNISKSGVKVISDTRKPQSELFTIQNNDVSHEMVNHDKIVERVKRATKKMALLKKKHSASASKKSKHITHKSNPVGRKPFIIQKCPN